MGIMNMLKSVIERFQASGKTEKEISGIIEEAANKATVNRDALQKREYKRPEMTVTTSPEEFVEEVMRTGVTIEQAKTAILKMRDLQRDKNLQNTNNWRKMHGMPMRRKQKARKKNERGKRAGGN